MDLHRRLTPEGDYRRVRSRSAGASTSNALAPAPADQRPGRRRIAPQETPNGGIKAAMGWQPQAQPQPSSAHAAAPSTRPEPQQPALLPPSAMPPAGRPSGAAVETPRVARRRASATATSVSTPPASHAAHAAPAPRATVAAEQPTTPRLANPLAFLYPTEKASAPQQSAPVATKDSGAVSDGTAKIRSRSVPSLGRGPRPTGLADITNGPRLDPITTTTTATATANAAAEATTPRAVVRRGSHTAGGPSTPRAGQSQGQQSQQGQQGQRAESDNPYATTSQLYGQPSPRAYTSGWVKSRVAPTATAEEREPQHSQYTSHSHSHNHSHRSGSTVTAASTDVNSVASTRGGEPSPVLPDLRRRRTSSVTAGKPSSREDALARQQQMRAATAATAGDASPTISRKPAVQHTTKQSQPQPQPQTQSHEPHQPMTGPYMHSWQIPKNPITHSSWYLAPENPVPLHLPAKVTPPIGHPERYDRIPPDDYQVKRFPTAEPLFCKYSPFDLVMPLD